jgi:hypothetical protein
MAAIVKLANTAMAACARMPQHPHRDQLERVKTHGPKKHMSHTTDPAGSRTVKLARSALLGVLLLLCSPSWALARTHHCEARAVRTHHAIRVKDLESWEPVDGRTLLIWAPLATRAHLLHLGEQVQELSSAGILTLIDGDHDGLITPCGHDGILVTEGPGAVASIRSIRYLSAKRTAELDRQTPSTTIQASLGLRRHRFRFPEQRSPASAAASRAVAYFPRPLRDPLPLAPPQGAANTRSNGLLASATAQPEAAYDAAPLRREALLRPGRW